MQQTILSSASCLSHGYHVHESAAADSLLREDVFTSPDPDPGYVYLSVSRTMPGFVQIASDTEDPRGLTWSLQTFSGTTRFRNVYAARTSDCRSLEARFREAVPFDQIPHHADLFRIPLRFARQILEEEARAFPPTVPPEEQSRPRFSWARAFTIALACALPLGLYSWHQEGQAARSVATQPAPVAAIVAPPAAVSAPAVGELPRAKPSFRISKM